MPFRPALQFGKLPTDAMSELYDFESNLAIRFRIVLCEIFQRTKKNHPKVAWRQGVRVFCDSVAMANAGATFHMAALFVGATRVGHDG